ncbi:MAG TPA: hypothetical protein VGM64_07540 [Lacunisphaera sp.]|jgi:predicted GH43/DUF377 family glycosyl hydrolase
MKVIVPPILGMPSTTPVDAHPAGSRPLAATLSRVIRTFTFGLLAALSLIHRAAAAERPSVVPFPTAKPRMVNATTMRHVYDEVKTPFKYGVVLKGETGELVDCPNVFRYKERWYMLYVANKDRIGYQTCLARSDDLLHWEKMGRVLSFRPDGWDAWQADGGPALYDTRWEGASHELGTYDGHYWMSYLGGARQGYEPDPLATGIAHTDDPSLAQEWTRLPENPVLSPAQSDVRDFERVTLYKTSIIRDDQQTLGAPFVMFYNGKSQPYGNESIGIAVSDDLHNWRRFGPGPVVSNIGISPWAISGDPQLTRIGDLWVMFYFGAFWQPNAFDTFACSYDLVHWTKWDGPHLIEPSEPYDKQFAHKPWLLKQDGVVYHFYCAVGTEGRVIALATSKDLGHPKP